jgi:hypothetical protein
LMKNHHRGMLRKQHREKLRNKQKGYHWTRHPVNRKPQPIVLRTVDPPSRFPPPEDSPPMRPERRIREILLCYPGGGLRRAYSAYAPAGTPSTHAMQRSLTSESFSTAVAGRGWGHGTPWGMIISRRDTPANQSADCIAPS